MDCKDGKVCGVLCTTKTRNDKALCCNTGCYDDGKVCVLWTMSTGHDGDLRLVVSAYLYISLYGTKPSAVDYKYWKGRSFKDSGLYIHFYSKLVVCTKPSAVDYKLIPEKTEL